MMPANTVSSIELIASKRMATPWFPGVSSAGA